MSIIYSTALKIKNNLLDTKVIYEAENLKKEESALSSIMKVITFFLDIIPFLEITETCFFLFLHLFNIVNIKNKSFILTYCATVFICGTFSTLGHFNKSCKYIYLLSSFIAAPIQFFTYLFTTDLIFTSISKSDNLKIAGIFILFFAINLFFLLIYSILIPKSKTSNKVLVYFISLIIFSLILKFIILQDIVFSILLIDIMIYTIIIFCYISFFEIGNYDKNDVLMKHIQILTYICFSFFSVLRYTAYYTAIEENNLLKLLNNSVFQRI
ncbi:hypothetical protein H312_00048 [Anncaliia algerae PRA339]|uniref:Uncharacterized protein n=1 Tax=Anncaliia algerae PRA339 TaxID=1288291 RepID=A0A059F5B2_9MICR|nr:hypothetical protein H312_00048 [Anncaliia algerae PRA339]